MRVFATSDLHSDHRDNWDYLAALSDCDLREDVLIVAGDVTHKLDLLAATLDLLRGKFARLFYVPGNHELWVRDDKRWDSLDKFHRIVELCGELGVETRAAQVEKYRIVPLFSWYDAAFDTEEWEDEAVLEGWGDFHHCRWPQDLGPLSHFFARLNEGHMPTGGAETISFSHFLPRAELLPQREVLRFKGLPRVAGCNSIETQVRQLGAQIHVFGHSHIRRDVVLDEVRYVQHGLGYPRERGDGAFTLKEIG